MQLIVNQWGNSAAIRLPKQLVNQLKLQKNDILNYTVSGNKIILEKIEPIKELTVKELFKDYNGVPVSSTPVIFESKGNEKW